MATNTSGLGLGQAAFAAVAAEYDRRWAVGLLACWPDGRVEWGGAGGAAEVAATRALAIAEALRWGQPTFHLAADDEVIWAVPLLHNALLLGGLVAVAPASSIAGRGETLIRAAHDLRALADEANLTNAALLEANRQAEGRERWRAEAIHELKSLPRFDLRRAYDLEEPALAAAIRRGDRGAAREILNLLLVGLHHAAGERLDVVKSGYLELVVTLARTAITAGGAPETLLSARLTGLAQLAAIDNQEDLARWLREMLEQTMDAVKVTRRQDSAALLADAVAHMREHLGEDLTRDQAAAIACLSPAHFSREFKRRYGCSFSELLTRLRVERAAELLRRTDKTVGLIAFECGFSDQSYFTKVFKRAKGVTPVGYRAG